MYTGYIIERSDDNCQTFKRINENAFVNTYPDDKKSHELAFYLDTLPYYNKEFCYRVKGVSPFGGVSIASDTVRAIGFEKLPVKPFIDSYNVIDNKNVFIMY